MEHISSFNSELNHLFTLKKNFILLGSAHNVREIRIKRKTKVEKNFFISIFKRK